jgi:hypothetical protein
VEKPNFGRNLLRHIAIGAPIIIGGHLLARYNIHALELAFFAFSVGLFLFFLWLAYRIWPTAAQRANDKDGQAQVGMVFGPILVSISLYLLYITWPLELSWL